MTAGFSATFANNCLNAIAGSSFTPPTATWAKLHVGDPGALGTANPSSVTTREQVTWAAASGGVIIMSNTPTWGTWSGTSPELLTHLSFWDASTSGNFIFSVALPGTVTITTGQPLNFSSLQTSIVPVAA